MKKKKLIKALYHDLDHLIGQLEIKTNVERALRGDLADEFDRANENGLKAMHAKVEADKWKKSSQNFARDLAEAKELLKKVEDSPFKLAKAEQRIKDLEARNAAQSQTIQDKVEGIRRLQESRDQILIALDNARNLGEIKLELALREAEKSDIAIANLQQALRETHDQRNALQAELNALRLPVLPPVMWTCPPEQKYEITFNEVDPELIKIMTGDAPLPEVKLPKVGDVVRVEERTETVRASWEGELVSIDDRELCLGAANGGGWYLERTEDMTIEVLQERLP